MLTGLVLLFKVLIVYLHGVYGAEAVDWWESATIYQIYPWSFMDSNGDGIGDLSGITNRLNYLTEIGVTATWLSPIYESPMADMGYDISNFTKIDPRFGTLADFDAMVTKAHKLGLKVILDFVPNHSSDECEWFKKSVRREAGYEDFYVWDDGKIDQKTGKRVPPSNWRTFIGGSVSAWTWNEQRQQFYLHLFLARQPDLNLRNPKVRARLIEVLEFWLDRGVDGFRIDSVSCFIEKRLENGSYPDNLPNTTSSTTHLPESIDLLYEWREYLDKYQKINGGDTRVMLAEAPRSTIEYLSDCISNGTHNGSQIPMNLDLVKLLQLNAKDMENRTSEWMSEIWSKHKTVNWLTGNHDESRLATRLGQSRVDIMTMIIYALPGVSITYYGEEIGMTDVVNNGPTSRDPQRTPMQWDTSVNAGFNTGNDTWLPVNPNYEFLNVETQRRTTRSHLHIYKGMIKLKQTSAFKAFKEEGGFDYGALNDQVFHIMRTDKTNEEYRVLANFGNHIEYVEGLTNKTMEYVLLNSYSPHVYGSKVDLNKRIYLMPFEAVVLRWTA